MHKGIHEYICAFLWLLSIVHAQNAKPPDIRVRMQSLVDKGVTPGTVTLVIKKGQVLSFEAVGYRDLETRKPMTTDTIFDIRSMTKPVTLLTHTSGLPLYRLPVSGQIPIKRDQTLVDYVSL